MKNKSPFDIIVGKYIRLKRKQTLKLIDDIAHAVKLSYAHLGTIERGEKSPNLYTFFRLWLVLGFDVNEIFRSVKKEISSKLKVKPFLYDT